MQPLFDVRGKLWWIAEVKKGGYQPPETEETTMVWSKPEFVELRFGFEVTMYIWNR